MGHLNKPSIVKQVEDILEKKLAIGESRHEGKILKISDDKIYSWQTFHTYLTVSCRFVKWAKETYKVKTVEEARQYADEWLAKYQNPYTAKTYIASLGKLYGESSDKFLATENRHRANIRRSRYEVSRDKHFSKKRNAELISFCQSTGLRRKELENIRGDQLILGDIPSIKVKGKGGRMRIVPICGSDSDKILIIKKMLDTGKNKVWGKVHPCADIHSYRRTYCQRVYYFYERNLAELPRNEKYFCRKDGKGKVFDKKAMKIASEALGHSRIGVIAENYLF